MNKTNHGSTRDRMRNQCFALRDLLCQRDRISIAEIAAGLEMHPLTVRRWVNAFSRTMDLRIEKGIVVIERADKCLA